MQGEDCGTGSFARRFGGFVGVPTTMPSADFCAAMTVLASTLSGTSGHDADLPGQD